MQYGRCLRVGFVACLLWGVPCTAVAQIASASDSQSAPKTDPAVQNAPRDLIPMPTLGGTQFWSDKFLFRDWRIQRHAVSGHYRLLDGNNLRHRAGTFEECRASLEAIRREQKLTSPGGAAVLLIHGLGDSRSRMASLGKSLERAQYTVFNVTYASTRGSVADHADSLASIVKHLEGFEKIHLVGFSLGNIVIRRFLADEIGRSPDGRYDPRIQRIVMIGPPNHGAEIATSLGKTKIFSLILGKSGDELGQLWVWAESGLAVPQGEFGIIAGGLENETGFNPFLPGDDDGIVTVDGAKLNGAADFALVHRPHTMLPGDSKVHEYTLHFLQQGRFKPDAKPRKDTARNDAGKSR